MPTSNERLQSRGVARSLLENRFANREVRQVVGHLNDQVYPQLVEKLRVRAERIERLGFDTGPQTTKRLLALRHAIDDVLAPGYRVAFTDLQTSMAGFGVDTAAWQVSQVEAATFNLLQIATPTDAVLQTTSARMPVAGRTLRQWRKDLPTVTAQRVMDRVVVGFSIGETTDEVVRAIRGTARNGFRDGVFSASRREAEQIVRTANTAMAAEARRLTFEKNEEILQGYQFVATLDDRTCPICGAQDGVVVAIGDTGAFPPLHPQCRCTIVPVLKSAEALGLDGPDFTPGQRAALDGTVPETQTFGAWLRDQPAALQDDVLGRTRGRLFREGGVELERFVERNRVLPLDQLRPTERRLLGE